jgi:hypothetical protein
LAVELLLLALGVFGVAAIGGAMAGLFDKNERIRRLMRRARTIPIRDVRDGQVAKVVGRVRPPGDPLIAPLTGRPCIYWEIEVTEWEGTHARQITRTHDQRDFLIDDGSGRALIQLRRAAIAARVDARWARHDDADERTRGALRALGIAAADGVGKPRQLTYWEAVIEPGEEIAASGRCEWQADPDPDPFAGSYRDMPRRLVVSAAHGEVVVVSGREKEPRWRG